MYVKSFRAIFIALILSLVIFACGDEEGSKNKDAEVTGDVVSDTETVKDVVSDKGLEDEGIMDTGTPDATDGDASADVTDTEWNPTTDEYNEAIMALEEESIAHMMVNLSAAVAESSAQFEEIENLNPPPLPPPSLPECPVVSVDKGIDPKIILEYVTIAKDENGNDTKIEGCIGQNGVFAKGTIEISRVGRLSNKYTRVTFKNHVRGKRVRAPEFNGCLKVTRKLTNTYLIESDPDSSCALSVKLGKDVFGKEIVYNATICKAVEIEIDRVKGSLRIINASIEFSKDSVDCNQAGGRIVTISDIEGKPSEIVYPFPLEGKTTCPLSGSIRISGKYFKSDNEYAALSYISDNGVGKLGMIYYLVNGETTGVNPTDPKNKMIDLRGIEGMCMADYERIYRCTVPDDMGSCSNIKGIYIANAGEPKLRYIDSANNVIANGPIGSEVPQDLCSAAAYGEGRQVKDFSMMMQIFGNCAVTFIGGRPSYKARPVAACGEIVFTNNEKTSFDIKYNGGGSPLKEFFGITSGADSISGTIGQDELNIKLSYVVPADKGGKYCFSDSYFGSNSSKFIRGATKERCLDNPLPPQSIWTPQNQTALWNTLDSWGKKTELGRQCSDYANALAKEISNYDDILDDDGKIIQVGNDIEWKDKNGNILPITEAYGKDLISVMADPVAYNGNADFFDPALKSSVFTDAAKKEITITLKKTIDGCKDANKCYKELSNEADADWNLESGQAFGYTPATQARWGKKFVFVVGRIKVNFPQYEDYKNACLAYVSGCNKLLKAENICDKITDPECLDETRIFCESIEVFCKIFDLEDPAKDLSGSIDTVPDSWKTPVTMSEGTPGDDLNLDQVDIKSIGEVIRGIANQKQGLMGSDKYRDFAFAYVDLNPDIKVNGNYVTVSFKDSKGNTKTASLQPANLLDGVLSSVSPMFKEKDLSSSGKFYSINSKTSPASIEYVENENYTFTLGTDYTGEIPVNLKTASIANIIAPPQLNMCLPPPIILDNIYFPTIRWSPLIKADGDLLKAILNDSKDAIDWSKFSITSGKDLVSKMNEIAKKMVTIYVGAYNRKEYKLSWPQARPLPQIYYHEELRDSIRIFPDIGFYTTTPMRWWDIAPSGRDYMHGIYQEIVDYLLDIALVRADHKVLTAQEIYGADYSPEKANDVAIVISLDIEWQPTIVINSDKLPGGNVTHFWRRDLVGLLVPSYYSCPKQ